MGNKRNRTPYLLLSTQGGRITLACLRTICISRDIFVFAHFAISRNFQIFCPTIYGHAPDSKYFSFFHSWWVICSSAAGLQYSCLVYESWITSLLFADRHFFSFS